jgi:hypothetical protein
MQTRLIYTTLTGYKGLTGYAAENQAGRRFLSQNHSRHYGLKLASNLRIAA